VTGLCPLADIITPNHFEFEWLCGAKATTTAQVIGAAQALMARGSIDRRRHQRRTRGHTGRRNRDPLPSRNPGGKNKGMGGAGHAETADQPVRHR